MEQGLLPVSCSSHEWDKNGELAKVNDIDPQIALSIRIRAKQALFYTSGKRTFLFKILYFECLRFTKVVSNEVPFSHVKLASRKKNRNPKRGYASPAQVKRVGAAQTNHYFH